MVNKNIELWSSSKSTSQPTSQTTNQSGHKIVFSGPICFMSTQFVLNLRLTIFELRIHNKLPVLPELEGALLNFVSRPIRHYEITVLLSSSVTQQGIVLCYSIRDVVYYYFYVLY